MQKSMSSKDFNEWFSKLVLDYSGEEIFDLLNIKNTKKKFNEDVEVYKPTRKDLFDPNYYHYNPNALLNVFVTRRFIE